MVEDILTYALTLEAVIKEGDVPNEFGMDIILGEGKYLTTLARNYYGKDCRFCIKISIYSYITFRWNKICNITFSSMMRIKNIHEDNLILID